MKIDERIDERVGFLKRMVFSFIAIIVALLLVALLAEVSLRLFSGFFLKLKSAKPVPFIIAYDPHAGYTLKKNLDMEIQYRDTDRSRFVTDNLGFRNERVVPNPDMVFLGDSFTAGDGVSQENMWTGLVAKNTGKTVMNFGVLGYGPHQELAVMEHYALPLKPRRTVWMIFQNDLYNAHSFIHEESGSLARKILLNSTLISLLKTTFDFYFTLGNKGLGDSMPVRMKDAVIDFFPDYEGYVYKWSEKEILESKGWREMTRIFLRARELAEENQCQLSFVFIPGKEQVYWESVVSSNESFAANFANLPLALKVFFDANNMRLYDSTEFLRSRSHDQFLYFSVDGHFNARGNRIFAEFMMDEVLKN